jgi:HD-GYP domain-containing protein (c-di-GMP phosphodiesterase class II)
MTSARPYRKALPTEIVINELKKCAGTQFDAELIESFLPIAIKVLNTINYDQLEINCSLKARRIMEAALGITEALDEISANKGNLYDANVVEACLKLFREKKYSS